MPNVDKELMKEIKKYKKNQKILRNEIQKTSADMGRNTLRDVLDSLHDKRKTAAQRLKDRFKK